MDRLPSNPVEKIDMTPSDLDLDLDLDPELDRLRAQEGLTPWEIDHLRWAVENYPTLTPEKALEMLRAFGM